MYRNWTSAVAESFDPINASWRVDETYLGTPFFEVELFDKMSLAAGRRLGPFGYG
jgi:hypothetical protein